MKRTYWLIFLVLLVLKGQAQNYVDTVYNINTDSNIEYGTAVNFAGESIALELDISYPTNAPSLNCGKPLALIIHGGAFSAGSKEDGNIVKLRNDFAKRGYVAAAVNYRLGYFQTDISKNCNVPNWNCINLADSSEWIRAWYRGIQDAKGALRYLVSNKDTYDIDPANVFVFGESAGAFISMGVAYLDSPSEKPASCQALGNVAAPHQNYYTPCIQGSSYDQPIANMDLSRPDLAGISGDLNLTGDPYNIKGVGSFYGGLFLDLFSEYSYIEAPALYLFHQPNDLIVPIGHDPIFKGFNSCAAQTGCVNIQDRPYSFGGMAINNLIDTLQVAVKPTVQFENSGNTANCLQQIANPSIGGHQFDSYWNRSSNMATFFSTFIDGNDCLTLKLSDEQLLFDVSVYPNPAEKVVYVKSSSPLVSFELMDAFGKILHELTPLREDKEVDISHLPPGIYLVKFYFKNSVKFQKLVVQ